jgi:excisionase family DNA binding protein
VLVSSLPLTVTLELSDEQLDELARRVAAILADREPPAPSAWLSAKDAAAHLACTPDRVHDLVSLGHLEPRRDGRRLLFKREALDAYLEGAS